MQNLKGKIEIITAGNTNYLGIILNSNIINEVVNKYFIVDNFILKALTTDITDIEITGIGSIVQEDNSTYFLTVTSKTLKKWSDKYNIKFKDLHVTIGFDKSDIHNVQKTNNNIICFAHEKYKLLIGKSVVKKSKKLFDNGLLSDIPISLIIGDKKNDVKFKFNSGEEVYCSAVNISTDNFIY